MSSQYTLQHKFYKTVKISKKNSCRMAGGCKSSKMYMGKN